MFRFLKEHSYEVVRLFFTQIGLSVFGLILSAATNLNRSLCLIAGIFSMIFYCCLLYSQGWEHGAKDKPRVDNGRLAYMPWRGLLYGGWANSVNLILVFLMFVCLVFSSSGLFGNIYIIVYYIERFILSGMHLGINVFLSPRDPSTGIIIADSVFQAIYFLCAMIPPVLSVGLGYYMGVNDKTIFSGKEKKEQ